MTKEQIIEELKRNMPEFKDEGIRTQIKKAIYLYIKLGEMKAFDERYYFGNSETRKRIYNLAQMNKDKPDEFANQNKLVCVGLAYLYKSIAEEFGIKVKVVRPNVNDWHELPVIYLEDGTMIKADLQEDLHNIKTKSKLKQFGSEDKSVSSMLEVIPDDELRTLCEEVGYIKPNENYTDDAIEEIKQKIVGMNSNQILDIILTDSRIYGNSDIESYELFRYYDEIIKTIIPRDMKQKIYVFNCYRELGEQIDSQTKAKKRQYTLCAYSVEKDVVRPYMYSKKNHRFLPVDLDTIKQLENEGLVLGSRPKEKGVGLLRRYIKNKEKEARDI